MKIALVYHIGNFYGGHLAYSNYLFKGLKQLGHDVKYYLLSHQKNPSKYKKVVDYIQSNNGIYDQVKTPQHYNYYQDLGVWGHMLGKGFLMDTYCYRNPDVLNQLIKEFDQQDIILWQDVGNFNQKVLRDSGDTSWLKLFKRNNSNTKQILMVHDGNMPQRFPYLATIIHNFDEIVGVHPASYNMACGLGLPVSLIVNPQDLSKVDKTKDNYHNKQKKTIFALGTWKASKRFQDIVKAVPWIDPEAKIDIVGEGLQRSYLMTQDKSKVKTQYVASQKIDPDVNQHPLKLTGDLIEDGILSRAKRWNKNFKLSNVITQNTRDKYFKDTFICIEPAWYKINYEIDAHFSRVLIEAMMNGVLIIGRNLGLSNNDQGNGTFFKAGENYIMIPWNATPKEFGDIVNKTLDISSEDYRRIVANNYKLLDEFSYLEVAKRFVEIGTGNHDNLKIKKDSYLDKQKWDSLRTKAQKILTADTPKGFRIPIEKLKQLQNDGYLKIVWEE